jgi:hypothetical protein
MEFLMADYLDFLPDVQRYAASADEAAVKGIVKHLGIALAKKGSDSSLVSCSADSELARVRTSWLQKKLARTESEEDLDAAIAEVCATMSGDNRKQRVTFYYLLADHFGALSALA